MGIRRKSIGLLYAFTMFAMCLSLLTFQQTGKAQESESGFNEQQREHSTSIHPSATIQKEIDIRLSEDDLSVWTNSSRNVYGDWTWTLPSDSEILNIDYTGESHTVTDNVIEFTELDGYVEVIYRTATGIERDGATITFASDWSVSDPFDLIAQVSFPEFYSSYITSIFPEQGHTLSPGHITWNLNNIDEWSFEVLFDFGLDITEVTFLDGNKNAHHTKPWPDWVFRRVQWISVHTTFDGIFDEDTDSLRWSVKSSSESDFTEIPAWTPALADDSWAVRESDVEGQSFIAEIFIPANVAIEDYTVKVTAYRNTGEGSVLLDSAESPSFMVIFNPWNDDDDPRYDQDVHNTAFSNQELQTYAASGTGHNYYGGENNDELVRWVLNPYTRQVFTTAFEEIKGTTSAQAAMEQLVDKVQVDDDDAIPEDSEVLRGRWGPPYNYRVNWRNAPAIVQAWETGSDHPTGQCMDFGGLLAAFGRSVGVPTRMITCVNCDGWNFHVWNEMWLNNDGGGAWYPADGTPGYQIGPTSRSDPSFQEEVSTSIAVYTHDANSSSRLDLLALYRPSLLADLESLRPTTDASLQDVGLSVETDQSTYTFGESVNIEVTAINTDTSSVSGSLQTVVSYVDYAGSYEVRTFPARNVTIPSGQSVVETYTFEQADYEWNGEFMVAATLNDTQGEASFTINDGLDVQFDVPETIAQGGTLPVSLYITNTLDTSISNVEVEVFFPPIIEEFNAPVQITIPGLTPGESYIESWNITPAEAGLQQIVTSVASMDAGNDQATASFEVQGWASLGVVLNVTETVTPGIPFDVVAQISNNGGQIATNTEVVLSLSEHLTTTDPLIIPIGNLEAEAMQEVTWSITADAAGTHTVLVEINETSVSDQETASQLVNAVEYAHRIQLTSSREQIAGRAPVMLTLTLENFGTIEDQISLDIASTNPTIGFTAYTDNQPLTGPVTVPAQSTAAFNLQITPHVWERGTVTIKAVSELDPTAVDYISIPVDGYVTSADNFVFLPLVIR